MKNTVMVLLLTALCTAPAHAGHSDYLTSLTALSKEKGFPRERLELLQPQAGPGKEKIAVHLQKLLASGELGRGLTVKLGRPTQRGKTLSHVTDRGSLEVFADGSRFRLRGDFNSIKPIPAAEGTGQLPPEQLEKLGREFVQQKLKGIITLHQGEKMTFLGTRYLRQGGADLQGKRKSEELFGNIAIFGREVDGLPVVGSGSKIAVWFAPDGEVIGADVDWPAYRPSGRKVALLMRGALMERVKSVAPRTDRAKGEATMTRFECGYVDLGATRRSPRTPIQPGCSVAYQGSDGDSGGTAWASTEYIPAGKKVIPDKRWPLATYIAGYGEPEPGKKIPVPGSEAPRDAPRKTIESVR